MKTAIIGMGNMGSRYALMIAKRQVCGMELAAGTRITGERLAMLSPYLPENFPIYRSGEDLFAAYDKGELELDTVVVVTPHYSHEKYVIGGLKRGLNVLCDKPAGVASRQARMMQEAYEAAHKLHPALRYGFIFHQRTFPVYIKMREIVKSGKYGGIKRINWIVTDWYRPDAYYRSAAWRGTWAMDGGGTLLNQCPHNLDLLQWICGMPTRVQGFCHEGKYHQIEVEDEVTAYLEWENGATGVFIASTGEAAGVNRFEISFDDALLVCEKGTLRIYELDRPEREYRTAENNFYGRPEMSLRDIPVEEMGEAYLALLNAFVRGEMAADGAEAVKSLVLGNAVYLSSWEKKMVEIPAPGSAYEKEFEARFDKWLADKSK